MNSKFVLLLIILITLSYSAYGQAVETTDSNETQLNTCPEIEKMDIFFIGRFLVDPNWKTERKKVGIKHYDFNRNELGTLGPNTPEKLRKYWKKRGVVTVSNPKICQRIKEALSTNHHLDKYQVNFRKVYFKVKNKFVIYYDPNDSRIDGPKVPTVVLNNNFNIIGYFKK